MLKLHTILQEHRVGKVTPFEKRILNLIHQKVINPYEEHYGNAIDPIDSAEELVANIDLVKEIYDFLNDVMELGNDASQSFIDLSVSNYRADGNYKDLDNAVYNPKEQKPYEKIYTEWAKLTPYLVADVDQTGYGVLPIVYDALEQQHYMIGEKDQLENYVKDYYEDIWWGDDDIIQALGEEEFIERLYVSNADARMMATEEANHMVEDMSDSELLERLGELDSPLRNEYDYWENKIDDMDADEDSSKFEQRKGSIIEQGRELLRREHYDHTYERLTEDLTDFLWDFGYITKNKGRDFVLGDHFRDSRVSRGRGMVDLDKLPGWLQFDRDTFIQDEVKEAMDRGTFEMLSESDVSAGYLTYEGDTYYIIDIDY
jgi:hypothetical protein